MTATNKNVTPDDTGNDQETPAVPRGLKILVVALGVAILAMLVLIIYKVLAGDHKSSSKNPAQKVTSQTLGSIDFTNVALKRPAGSVLVKATNGPAEIMLQFSGPEGDTLIFINRQTGAESRISVPK